MVPTPKSEIHEKGQYFTSNTLLKQCVNSFVLNNPERVLEPSVGRGDLIDSLCSISDNIHFDMYEIDPNIEMLPCVNLENLIYGDFLTQTITRKYKTIIGNPPYVKTSTGNLYIDFIEQCHNMLEDKGELIFIVPSDFLKLTSAAPLIRHMMESGTFTHVFRPNNENLFENASIDVIVFRYCLDPLLERTVLYNDEPKRLVETNGIITFVPIDAPISVDTLNNYFDIYVGMVTGCESVFKNETFGTINILNKKDTIDKYIMTNVFPTTNHDIDTYLLEHKEKLIGRKIRKFNESNWFEWGALRNYDNVTSRLGEDCIYIHTLTRDTEVAFVDKVTYFGGGLIALIPKINAPRKLDLNKVVRFINSIQFRENYIYSNRFKIGHRQICNSTIDLNYVSSI